MGKRHRRRVRGADGTCKSALPEPAASQTVRGAGLTRPAHTAIGCGTMTSRAIFRLCVVLLASAFTAHGQIVTSLTMAKKQYVAGEPVMAVVTITNHAGQELTFHGDPRKPWLDFVVKRDSGSPSIPSGRLSFGAVKIPAGQSMSRQVDLASLFPLKDQGTFNVYAVVRTPEPASQGFITNRCLFSIIGGRPYWTQKVGVKGQTREFRVLNYAGERNTQLYAQVVDDRTGMPLNTFSIGEALMFRKPQVTVDATQVMHVLFLVSPTMWAHAQVNTDGKLVKREFHLRGAQGDPSLMTFGDGRVAVANSQPYDPAAVEAARSKARKASDRPN